MSEPDAQYRQERLGRRCVTHHHACDCREALMQECLVMLAVFRGCMVTRTLPTNDSPCARKVCELLEVDAANADQITELRDALADAWSVIHTLHMEVMDNREAWPRALDWLQRNEKFRPENR